MTSPEVQNSQSVKPKVIIVGAGIAGLMLAILLEKANVPYDIFERALEVKPLGSALAFGCNVAPLFKQMGIYEEFVAKGKLCKSIDMFDEQRQLSFAIDFKDLEEMGGAKGFIIARSILYDILLKQVPPEKLHKGKKVLSTLQGENGVLVRCSDGTNVEGDILVGADGAYSGVRQNLYAQLKKENKLPPSDSKPLPYSCVCIAATTNPMDPAKLPELNDPFCHFNNIRGTDKPYSWLVFTTKDNVVCWGAIQYLDGESQRLNDTFRSTEWGSEAVEAMCEDVRDFPIPGGDGTLTLGDLMDNTPKSQISKAMLEEKIFDTWYHGRTVLIGDACHKVHPASGKGALLAMHDAVALANWISVLPSTSIEDTERIFREYKNERYPVAKDAYSYGKMLASNTAKGFKAGVVRYLMKNMPTWLWRLSMAKDAAVRPQVSFLPLVKDNGTVAPSYQASLEKTLAINKAKQESVTV